MFRIRGFEDGSSSFFFFFFFFLSSINLIAAGRPTQEHANTSPKNTHHKHTERGHHNRNKIKEPVTPKQ